jgi:hypothetical protein
MYYLIALYGYATSACWQTETAKTILHACHKMLGGVKNVTKEKRRETWQEQLLRISGIDVTVCPLCQKGKMCRVERLLPVRCNSPPELTEMRTVYTQCKNPYASAFLRKKHSCFAVVSYCPKIKNSTLIKQLRIGQWITFPLSHYGSCFNLKTNISDFMFYPFRQ